MQNFVNLLNKTFRAYKIYPGGHEIPRYFLRQLWDALRDEFKESSELVLFIEKNRLIDGNSSWEGDESEDNIAWVLYKNGIKGIVITTKITLLDLENFFKAIQKSSSGNDKFSLIYELSQNEFSGMTFEFIPDFIHEQGVPVPETFQDFKKLKVQEPATEILEIEGQIEASIEIPIIIESREVFTISPEEERILSEEIERERQTPHLFNFLKHVFTVIEKGSLDDVSIFQKAIEELILLEINKLNIGLAGKLLQNLKFLRSNIQDEKKGQLFDTFFKNLCKPELLETIVKTFVETKPKELENFLVNLHPVASLDLFKISTDLPNRSARQILYRAILSLRSDNLKDLLDYIYRNKQQDKILIAGLEFIATGKIKDAKEFLLELQQGADPNIKKNLIEAISSIEGDLMPFFYDPSQDVRLTTYFEMKKNPKKAYANLVVERLKSSELFYKMDPLEKKQFFSLVPEFLDYQVVENTVKEILGQNMSFLERLIKSRKYYETIQFLVNSLIESKNRKVYILLIEAIKVTKDSKIRAMCSEALKQLREF
ncbi:MAG: hypothetical protein ABIM20_04905 [candidate division WOR-3 bacterium]